MKIYPYIFLVGLLAITSCTGITETDLPPIEPKLVVNCLFCPNEPFLVNLSATANPTDSATEYITNAKVRITPENQQTQLLSYIGGGKYIDTLFFPQPSINYTLEIETPGYDNVSAIGIIPLLTTEIKQVSIKSGFRHDEVMGLGDEATTPIHYFTVLLKDSLQYDDYMAVAVTTFEQWKYYTDYENGIYDIEDRYDTGYLNSNDITFTSEGLESFDQHTLLPFRDLLFTNRPANITFDMVKSNELRFWLRFLQLSPEAFTYLKSWIIHSYTQDYDFWEIYEPAPLYSNIENGYGIFAGYNSSIMEVFPDSTIQF